MRVWSVQLAQYLVQNGKGVLGVELFGSLARGMGTMDSDFDLIICVDGFTAAEWMAHVTTTVRHGLYHTSLAATRQRYALKAIELTPVDIEAAVGIQPWKQDYFLFPVNWRDRLETLQGLGHHADPMFMWNIARDALTFVPHQGFAFLLFPREK